ncbi:hypothetical protein AT1219_190027 [Vibrio alginolyticus]
MEVQHALDDITLLIKTWRSAKYASGEVEAQPPKILLQPSNNNPDFKLITFLYNANAQLRCEERDHDT